MPLDLVRLLVRNSASTDGRLRPGLTTRSMLRLAVLLALLIATGGCASLPPNPPRAAESAGTDTGSTALARIADARRGAPGGAGSEVAAAPGAPPAGAATAASAPTSAFRLLPIGDPAFNARLALARQAEKYLDVHYYLIHPDEVGLRFLRELRAAAERGVRVRLLVDDLYTPGSDELLGTLAATPNIEVRLFNPLPVRGMGFVPRLLLSLHEFGRINHRMHNKLFVADNAFAITGGRNMAAEYFMRNSAANFIDLDLLSAGSVVRMLSSVFDDYWNSAHTYPVQVLGLAWSDRAAARRRFDELTQGAVADFPSISSDPLGRPSVEAELARGRVDMIAAPVRLFADSPDKAGGRRPVGTGAATVTEQTLGVFASARSEVVIVSPYLIPGPRGLAMMKEAIDHDVRISMFTNSLGSTDEPLVHWSYRRYRQAMLKLGVKVYEVSPTLTRESGRFGDFRRSLGRLHAKAALIDRRWLYVGSMNLDPRSARANTELGLVVDSPRLGEEALHLLNRDGYTSMYRLRLREDDDRIEWVTFGPAGEDISTTDEPGVDWWLRLRMWLLSPLAREDLL
jgi:putative cardiolipin synthase